MNRKKVNAQDKSLQDMEAVLKQAAQQLPKPRKGLPVLQEQAARKRIRRPWYACGRAAAILLVFVLLGSSTAVAASPDLQQAVIRFFTGGTKEDVPYDVLSGREHADSGKEAASEPQETKTDQAEDPVTVGNVTLLQNQVLDEHFTASYFSSPDYLDTVLTPSGRKLFYTVDAETEERTYYQLAGGDFRAFTPKIHVRQGSAVLKKLPGIMNGRGEAWSFSNLNLTFTVEWQQCGEDIMVLDRDLQRFTIDAASAELPEGETIPEDQEGRIYANGLAGDTEWVEVFLMIDAQATQYQYPFLYNIRTEEVRDPLADVDFSAYPCITELEISDDQKTAEAMAGQDHASCGRISIDLESGSITAEKVPTAPVSDCYLSFATGAHTVFYTTGTQEHMDGYLYDETTGTTKQLFKDVAWGYMWEYGFAERYVDLIGGNYAAVYKEPENEVYLLDLTNGSRQLLKGIPASHETQFFWNMQHSMLSIESYTQQGTARLAFFIPGTKHAWYFDRTLSDEIQEESSCWYGERGYLIQAVSKDGDMHYLSLYEYTP